MLYSIIMPCYNSEKTIEKSILSVINQTYVDWELIVVDDGSSDDTLTIVGRFAKNNTNIRVLKQHHSGPGAARNMGISEAKGDYIAFLDSDDYWEPSFLQLIDSKNDDSLKDIIFYDLVLEDSAGKMIGLRKSSVFNGYCLEELIRLQMAGTLMWGMTKVIKTSILQDNNCFFSTGAVGEEALFSYKALSCSKNVAFIDKPIYHYVSSESGQHLSGGLDPWGPIVVRLKTFLLDNNQYEKYEKTINSFALKALTIHLYRLSKTHSKTKELKQAIKQSKRTYDFKKIDKKVLDKKTKVLRVFIRLNFVLPILLLSKMRG